MHISLHSASVVGVDESLSMICRPWDKLSLVFEHVSAHVGWPAHRTLFVCDKDVLQDGDKEIGDLMKHISVGVAWVDAYRVG